ncbi:FtsB family cell division protein [Rhodovibrionaceae bacterium A322]
MVAYFAYHTVQGERGFLAYLHLSQELQQAEAIQSDLAQERQVMERRVALLGSQNLDPDLLDERARELLNYGQKGDLLIFLPENLQR